MIDQTQLKTIQLALDSMDARSVADLYTLLGDIENAAPGQDWRQAEHRKHPTTPIPQNTNLKTRYAGQIAKTKFGQWMANKIA